LADRLVLALGAEAKVDSVPGSAEYSIPFTTLEDALVREIILFILLSCGSIIFTSFVQLLMTLQISAVFTNIYLVLFHLPWCTVLHSLYAS